MFEMRVPGECVGELGGNGADVEGGEALLHLGRRFGDCLYDNRRWCGTWRLDGVDRASGAVDNRPVCMILGKAWRQSDGGLSGLSVLRGLVCVLHKG